MNDPFVNKVAESGLVTLDLESYYPKGETAVFDMKDHLFMGLILKEKEFREALKNLDWEKFRNKEVAVTCTADAIIPVWAYMLVASYLQPVAKEIVMGDERELHKILFLRNLSQINVNEFADKRIVIKGCGETPIADRKNRRAISGKKRAARNWRRRKGSRSSGTRAVHVLAFPDHAHVVAHRERALRPVAGDLL